jgi:hypothetical protein
MATLFPDVGALVHKAADDLRNTMTARIATHEAAEAARLEAMRVKIQQEEAAKALAAQQAEQRRKDDEAAERLTHIQWPVVDASIPLVASQIIGLPAEFVEILAPRQEQVRTTYGSYPKVAEAPAIDTGARMNLGQIKEQIAPFSISAEGLATLGIIHVDTQGAAKYYRVSDCQRIFDAIQGLKK